MQVPLQIVFEHLDHSDFLELAVRKEALRLERFYDRITSARVVIARPQHRRRTGDSYCVRLHITLPGSKHIDILRDPAASGRHEDAHVTIKDAFNAAGRQLQDQVRRLDGEVKTHETLPHGTISALTPSVITASFLHPTGARSISIAIVSPEADLRTSRSGKKCDLRNRPREGTAGHLCQTPRKASMSGAHGREGS